MYLYIKRLHKLLWHKGEKYTRKPSKNPNSNPFQCDPTLMSTFRLPHRTRRATRGSWQPNRLPREKVTPTFTNTYSEQHQPYTPPKTITTNRQGPKSRHY